LHLRTRMLGRQLLRIGPEPTVRLVSLRKHAAID